MSYSREFLIQQFKKGVRKYLPIASAAETMINYKLSQLDENDWARIEEFFNSFKFPLHVYRGLKVKSEHEVNVNNPGNNWTVDTALFHAPLSAFRNSNYILEGYIEEDQIDWPETVQNFMYYSVNAARNQRYPENEVTIKKGQVPHNLTGSMKESLKEGIYVPDKPVEDKYHYYWELESRQAKDIHSLRDKFAKKFPEQWEVWGEQFDWMIENEEENFKDSELGFSLHIEYDDYLHWGYMYINENKKRYEENLNEAYLDPEEKFWDYSTKEVQPGKYIDTSRSEIGWVDNLIHNIKYFEQNKGLTARIVDMTPEEYFEECSTIFHNSVDFQKKQTAADTGTIEHLTDVIKKFGRRFPIPYINIANNSQEGRHRMYVLGELFGWDKAVPVLIIQDVNNVRVPGKELN